jgi:chromosome segregation ATPase
MMEFKSSRGIQEAQVWQAADALLAEGLRPTIERVRQTIGSGSPNTVSPMLERWFATLGKRLEGRVGSLAEDEAAKLPLAVVQAAQQFWGVALREAAQAQVQVSEARSRELELQQAALERKDASLHQRESAFEEARKSLDAALASSQQAREALELRLVEQGAEATRQRAASDQEISRLNRLVGELQARKEVLRTEHASAIGARERTAKEAEERHLAQERRLLADVDRERQATRQAASELAKEQKLSAAELETSQRSLEAERVRMREAQQTIDKMRAELNAASAAAAQTDANLGATQRLLKEAESRVTQEQQAHSATRELLAAALSKFPPARPKSTSGKRQRPT